MDNVTLAAARQFALQVAAGFSSVSVDEPNSTINFTLNDGTQASLKVPTPKDGVSIVGIVQDSNKHLICKMSDGTSIDAGEIPEQEIKISAKDGNAIETLQDGLFVAPGSVEISDSTENNLLKTAEDGLYVVIDKNDPNTAQQVLDIINDNLETENIDFSDF